MKQTIYSALLFCAAFASCSKQPVTGPVSDGNPSIEIKLEQLAEMSVPDRILAFNMLTPEEKYQAWYKKADKLSRQTDKYSSEQIALITEMKNNLKVDYYRDGTDDEREINKSTFIEPWLKRAEKVFNKEELYDVAFTLGTSRIDFQVENSDVTQSHAQKQLKSCVCSVSSMFGCTSWSVSGIGIDITFENCGSGECASTGSGCGFGGFFTCNGSC